MKVSVIVILRYFYMNVRQKEPRQKKNSQKETGQKV